MEVTTSAVLYRLDSDSPAVTTLHDSVNSGLADLLPRIRTFRMATGTAPGLLTLALVYNQGGPHHREYPGLIWNLADGTVELAGPYGKHALDVFLPGAEAIWVDVDSSLPVTAIDPSITWVGQVFNVVMYANKAGDTYPVFFEDGKIPTLARFVDGGRKVAVRAADSMDNASWMLVERGGTVTPLPTLKAFDVRGTRDGYVFLTIPAPDAPMAIRYHRFTAGNPVPEEAATHTDLEGTSWRIVWVTPFSGGADLPPFPPVGGTGQPTTAVTPAAPPAPTEAPPPPPSPTPLVLAPGVRARVTTTAGDQLRVRSGPGTAYAIEFNLAAGSEVSVMEGPTAANGFNWWRIRADDGRTGWAVEGVTEGGEFLQTLTPIG